MSELTPTEIVGELDQYIIGQKDAKRAVAIAVRNRWRRMQLEPDLAADILPKNIIMIGPTGVGKTEIARRLAQLVRAPFIKVEASRYTEVGYHGRDVETMVRDLAEVSVKMVRQRRMEHERSRAEEAAEAAQQVPAIPARCLDKRRCQACIISRRFPGRQYRLWLSPVWPPRAVP